MTDPALIELQREVRELRRQVLALANLVTANTCDPDTSRALLDLAERSQRRAAND